MLQRASPSAVSDMQRAVAINLASNLRDSVRRNKITVYNGNLFNEQHFPLDGRGAVVHVCTKLVPLTVDMPIAQAATLVRNQYGDELASLWHLVGTTEQHTELGCSVYAFGTSAEIDTINYYPRLCREAADRPCLSLGRDDFCIAPKSYALTIPVRAR